MREHPKTLSEAIRAARSARQNVLQASGSRHGYRNRRTLATEGAARTQRRSKLGEEERAKLLKKGGASSVATLDTCVKIARRTRTQTPLANEPTGAAVGEKFRARPTSKFVHPNRFSVLSEVEEKNDYFETVETNTSSVHPTEDCEASQAPRPRNQNPELRTRSGRNLNLEDKTTSAFSPAEPRNREVSGFPDQDLAFEFASQPPVTNDYEISNVNLSTHLEELLRFKGKVDGQKAVFLLDSGSTHDFISAELVRKHGVETRIIDGDFSVTLADGRTTSETRMCTVPLTVKIADESEK